MENGWVLTKEKIAMRTKMKKMRMTTPISHLWKFQYP
jgi:hypothetical protein